MRQGRFADAVQAFEQAFATSADPLDLVDAATAAEDAGLLEDERWHTRRARSTWLATNWS